MANYNNYIRSNYFKVKSINKLIEIASLYKFKVFREGNGGAIEPNETCQVLLGDDDHENKEYVCLLPEDMYADDIYLEGYYDEEAEDFIDEPIYEKIQPLLFDNQVVIIREIGYEKLRYLVAVDVYITKDEIFYTALDKTKHELFDRYKWDNKNRQLEY